MTDDNATTSELAQLWNACETDEELNTLDILAKRAGLSQPD